MGLTMLEAIPTASLVSMVKTLEEEFTIQKASGQTLGDANYAGIQDLIVDFGGGVEAPRHDTVNIIHKFVWSIASASEYLRKYRVIDIATMALMCINESRPLG